MKAPYYFLSIGGFFSLQACGDSKDPDWEPPPAISATDSGAQFGSFGRDAGAPVQGAAPVQPSATRDAGAPLAAPDAGSPRVDSGAARVDAGRPDSGPPVPVDSGAPPPMGGQCIASGKQCEPNTCCPGSQCVMDPQVAIAVCAANCTTAADCQSGCCAKVNGNPVAACAPVLYCNSSQPPPPPPSQCLGAGVSCSPTSALCCAGTRCITDPLTALDVCAVECTQNSQCASQCCSPLRDEPTVSVCGPIDHCTGGGAGPRISLPAGCGELVLLASDGTFLGDGTSSTVAADSVCNPVGLHGSTVSADSIFSSVGAYGSTVGAMSAHNAVSSMPPALICAASDTLVAFVTENTVKTPRIDPDLLCATLAASGL